MPKRTDLKSILIIGAGPIVIGQACEFDYSGTQACKALKDEGYRVILVNSNPATIDQFAHALTLRMREVFGITKPEPKTTEAAISRRLLFVNAQEVNKLTLEPVKSKGVGMAA